MSPVFWLVSAEYAPSFAFASGLELDHVLFGLEADAERLLEIAYLFRGHLLLCRALLFGLLLRLLAGSARTPPRRDSTGDMPIMLLNAFYSVLSLTLAVAHSSLMYGRRPSRFKV